MPFHDKEALPNEFCLWGGGGGGGGGGINESKRVASPDRVSILLHSTTIFWTLIIKGTARFPLKGEYTLMCLSIGTPKMFQMEKFIIFRCPKI